LGQQPLVPWAPFSQTHVVTLVSRPN
jgi:hypothetical protein